MSPRSTSKAAVSVVDSNDVHVDQNVTIDATDLGAEDNTSQTIELGDAQGRCLTNDDVDIAPNGMVSVESESFTTNRDTVEPSPQREIRADALADQLDELVRSVGVVEELSRRAREAAADDLARYDALLASKQQYADRTQEASAITDQARAVRERAFGQEARAAAEPLAADAERVLQAFADLSAARQEQATTFLTQHPDVELLIAERRHEQELVLQREALAARRRNLDALLVSAEAALEQGLIGEGRRALAILERDFSDETSATERLRLKLAQKIRAEKDAAARRALALAAEHQARGDLDAAVTVLEQVDVHGLSLDLSEDVFGRWSDACSRLAQTAGASLVRSAPGQGRGLILYSDPAFPKGLIVFSSLGMGPGFPQGTVVSDPAVLRRARSFREASPLPVTSWTSHASTEATAAPAALIRH